MTLSEWPAFCRDCLADAAPEAPCPNCGWTRILAHPELDTLAIAHLDCDAFYAAIEKRDDPSLHDKPVIVGGGTRGVVSTACYIARHYGVRSAMPMFQAQQALPRRGGHQAAHEPITSKWRAQIRGLMRALTPLVEPLSLDEAYLDLSGTDRIHGMAPGPDHGEAGAARSSARSASPFPSVCPATNSSPSWPANWTSRAASP